MCLITCMITYCPAVTCSPAERFLNQIGALCINDPDIGVSGVFVAVHQDVLMSAETEPPRRCQPERLHQPRGEVLVLLKQFEVLKKR